MSRFGLPRMRGPQSLFGRLSLFVGLWVTGLLAVGGVGLTALYQSAIFRDLNDGLDATIATLISSVELDANDNIVVPVELPDPRYSETFSGRYWVIAPADRPGRPWARSRSLWDERLRISDDHVQTVLDDPSKTATYSRVGPENLPLQIRVRSVRLRPDQDPILVFAAADRTPLDRDVRHFAVAVFWALTILAVVLMGVVLGLVRLGLRPLYHFGVAVSEVRAGKRTKLTGDAPSELQPLAEELNALIDHNRDIVKRARARAGDLAHALKTPIAVLLSEAEGEDSVLATQIRRQISAMRSHVDRHLKSAGAAARARDAHAYAALEPVLDDLKRTVPRLYRDREIEIDIALEDGTSDLSVLAAREDVTEMVGNLLDNAYKWAKSRVLVAVRPMDDRNVSITVSDDGPGLTPSEKEAVLQRGARLDEASPGSGLGLAIVHDLAEAIGGEVALSDSELGGLSARLSLPCAPPTAA